MVAKQIQQSMPSARTRIGLCRDELREAARSGEPARALARKWVEVARSIEAHLSATDEVCLLAVLGTGPQGRQQVRAIIAEHEDIVEVLRQAGLQPPGSPSWWRLADETMSLWARLTEQEAPGVLTELALRTDQGRRGPGWRWHVALSSVRASGCCWPDGRFRLPRARQAQMIAWRRSVLRSRRATART